MVKRSEFMPGSDSEQDIPNLLDQLICEAERAGASDVHLQLAPDAGAVSFRVDGVMIPMRQLDGTIAERVAGRIKFLARLKTYQFSMPQDGRIDRDSVRAKSDIRVATYPTVTGEKIVMRLFGPGGAVTLDGLGVPVATVDQLQRFLRQRSGMLLLTGPAGSGKTTAIYACLRYLVELGGNHIITVEDPVEQIVPGVMQTEVNEARGLTFAKAARHLLRQDPQVLVIGEIRDEETANIAVRAALTGHLVVATLHAGSCRGVFERLLDLCADNYSAVTAVEFVLNQRLVRRVCDACGGEGCGDCIGTGYRGRVPVIEWLRVDDSIRERIRRGDRIEPAESLRAVAEALVERGLTNQREIDRVIGEV